MSADTMTVARPQEEDLFEKSLFLVWGPPSYGPRSKRLALELGIGGPIFVQSFRRRGLLWAFPRYVHQAITTLALLLSRRPRIVFVQSPPSLAVLFVWLYCALTRSRYLIDAHSAALQLSVWLRPRALQAFLARRAVATIVTNERLGTIVEEWGGRTFVLPDVPTTFAPTAAAPRLEGGFNVAVVSTFSPDEPLAEIVVAAADFADVHFYVTGRPNEAARGLRTNAPQNVHFTGFLPDEDYYALLRACDVVMCLTTRDNTMQRGACEALWLGRPIITSDWPLLRSYFRQGAVHVASRAREIREGVLRLRADLSRYEAEVRALQSAERQNWEERTRALASLVRGGAEVCAPRRGRTERAR